MRGSDSGQVTSQLVEPLHVSEHAPAQVMLQSAESVQVMLVPAPTVISQSALFAHITVESSPEVSTQSAESEHCTIEPSPMDPRHWELIAQFQSADEVAVLMHSASPVQDDVHPSVHASVQLSAHSQLTSVQAHPAPVQSGAVVPSPPQAAATTMRRDETRSAKKVRMRRVSLGVKDATSPP